MPVKAERALEKVADKRGLEGEERDRFVYGTLRHKFNWKPKRELDKSRKTKMSAMDKVTHLQEINKKIDVCFEDDDERKRHIPVLAGGLATGGAGLYATGAMKGQGLTAGQTLSKAKQNLSSIGRGGIGDASTAIGSGAKIVKKAGATAWKSIMEKIRFPKFEAKKKEIQFAGGYVNTGIGVRKEKGAGAHFNRNAGKYIGSAVATPVLGLPAGFLIDRSRKKHNILKARTEPKVEPLLAKGHVYASGRYQKLIELGSKLDQVIAFQEEDEPKNKTASVLGKALVVGGLGYGGYQANKLVKYGGGYKKVGKDLLSAAKRGFRK